VQESVYEQFCEKFARAVDALHVGDGLEEGVTIGPMIDGAALDKVETLVADAVAAGGKIVVGGKRDERGGTFYQPTVIANASTKMRIAHEEVFGPVAPIFRFSTEEEAVALANDTEFGLAAYFYTKDGQRAWRVSKALEYGMVGMNCGLISTAVAPFGGIKQSGMGREGGPTGIDEYLEMKYVNMA
jgi:succinate-semialdehyde dehydrogenase/glutarate-semialdehyde dehydrogenase